MAKSKKKAEKNREKAGRKQAEIRRLLGDHFAPRSFDDLSITERQFPFRVRADLQRALDARFGDGEGGGRETRIVRFTGVRREYSHEGLNFPALIAPSHYPAVAVPPQYEEVDVGAERPVRCLKNGLWLLREGKFAYAVLLSPAERYGRIEGMSFQVAAPAGEEGAAVTAAFFDELEAAVLRAPSYRGKILSLEKGDSYSGAATGIQVHRLRTVAREQVILPARTLDLLDRNVIGFVNNRSRLAGLKLSTRKGLLFYGPPGTGKTHTLHYLAAALPGHTTLLVSGEQVGLLGEYMTLARLLQPSMVVIEDADLIARDRSEMNTCEEVLLNKLLNEMDGLREDADILFVLTTNRPEALEAALASRPGRVDQAIEFPLPDDAGRDKLVRLYSRGMAVPDDVVAEVVRRTEGVSAAFIKELMRRSAQFLFERGGEGERGALESGDVDRALDEMLFTGGSLNRTLLGGTNGDGRVHSSALGS